MGGKNYAVEKSDYEKCSFSVAQLEKFKLLDSQYKAFQKKGRIVELSSS